MAKSIEQLIAELQDWDERRRRAAAAALGEAGDPAAVEPLIAALGDAQADVRAEVARALGRLGQAQAALPLTEALGDAYPQVRSQVALALGQLRQPGTAEALVQQLPYQRARVIQCFRQALARFGELAQEPLLAGLKAADPVLRQAVAEALGKLEARWAVPELIGRLNEEDPPMRRTIAEALGRIGDARAMEPLLRCLGEADVDLRCQAVLALGYIGDPRALPRLRKLLHPWSEEAPPRVKQAAEEALARIEEARKGFSGRELMPVDLDPFPAPADRSLVLVEPTAPATPERTGRELSPTDEPEPQKRPTRWWPFGNRLEEE